MRKPGPGCPTKVTMEVKTVVEEQMRQDDETSAYQLHTILTSKGYQLSIWTILRCRASLGWTFRGNAYCQLIRDVNKEKRLTWVQEYKDDSFDNLLSALYKWKHTGDSAVERKEKHLDPNLGLFVFVCNYMHICIHSFIYFFRPKHPLYRLGCISLCGVTGICIFDGIMDAPLHMNILEKTLFLL